MAEFMKSPYNFVGLSKKIYQPSWESLIGHDLPIDGGLSGHIEYELKAETPIFVGGTGNGKEKKEFFSVDNRPAIPGSSLKGMLRNVYSIMTYSAIQPQDIRGSSRDLHDQTYRDRVTRGSATGWLRFREREQDFVIIECQFSKIRKHNLEAEVPGLRNARTAGEKYAALKAAGKLKKIQSGGRSEYYVMTGEIPNKENYFKFAEPAQNAREYVVSADLVRRVALLYNLRTKKQDEPDDTTYKEFLKNFIAKRISDYPGAPVFFTTENGVVTAYGFAQLFRLLHDASPADLVPAAHKADVYRDMANLLFGYTTSEKQTAAAFGALKGRVFFTPALLQGNASSYEVSLVLMGPRPSFYPNYLVQDVNQQGIVSKYKTYLHSGLQIRGWKRYPRRTQIWTPASEPGEKKSNGTAKVQGTIKPVQKGSSFYGRIIFHNLHPTEFGALIWSLALGGDGRLCHSIGGGKPYGFGSVKAIIKKVELRSIAGGAAPVDEQALQAWMAGFETEITSNLRFSGNLRDQPEIRELLAMCEPVESRALLDTLQYYRDFKGYQEAKRARKALVPYLKLRDATGEPNTRVTPVRVLSQASASAASNVQVASVEKSEILKKIAALSEGNQFIVRKEVYEQFAGDADVLRQYHAALIAKQMLLVNVRGKHTEMCNKLNTAFERAGLSAIEIQEKS